MLRSRVPQSHIHSGLNQQDLISSNVFLADSDQYADERWWSAIETVQILALLAWLSTDRSRLEGGTSVEDGMPRKILVDYNHL